VTVLTRFANRSATGADITPSRSGQLAPRSSERQPVELASGYRIVPGEPAPVVPADLSPAAAAAVASGPRGYLVQFTEGSADEVRRRVGEAGGSVVTPLAGGTWLVRMDEAARSRLADSPGDPWIAEWAPAWKLSTEINRSARRRVDLIGLVFPDGDADAVASSVGALGASDVTVHRNDVNQLVRFSIEASQVAQAAFLDDLAWLEPAPQHAPFNDKAQWVVQTGVAESRRVWDMGLRGQGQLIMVADSGIRPNHESFNDPNVPLNDFGEYPDHRKIVAYRRGSDAPYIEFGDDAFHSFHGSHTSGTAAGNNDPTTTSPMDGMAKEARIDFSDLAGNQPGFGPPSDLNELFRPSWLGGARISSNSWGSASNGAYSLHSMQVDQFMWNHPDYLILFANGNFGVAASTAVPASAKNCISVGGTGNGELSNTMYVYSSRGPTADLRRKPTICAPADQVASSFGTTRYAYEYLSGTSMATPAVAGSVALMRQYLAEGWYPSGAPVAAHALQPSAALLKAMLINSGENDVLNARVPDNSLGWGRVTLDNVLHFAGDTRRLQLIDVADGMYDEQFVEYTVTVTDSREPLSIALCWTDPPGHPGVARQLINDLDLVVTDGTRTYVGNRMFDGVSLLGPGRDSLNVEECVRVPAPGLGNWTVRVEGHRVLAGPQPFAICVTGGIGQGTGAVALDRFDYALTDTLAIEVLDSDLGAPPSVTVTSSTEAAGEVLVLEGSDGLFRGAIAITPTSSPAGDGRLTVSANDVLTVHYTDESRDTVVVTTARVNVDAPIITDVRARALSGTSALVTWSTDRPSTSRLLWGRPGGAFAAIDSGGLVVRHAVVVRGLSPGESYSYDVESASPMGSVTRDDLGGRHRAFTSKSTGQVALVLGRSSTGLLNTWQNALDDIGLDADVFIGESETDPPLVGDSSHGLRRYSAVLWQIDPDAYPALSDPQRAAVDSLLDGGGRLLLVGHDIAFSLSDGSSPAYTEEREFWLERSLKTRYVADQFDYNFKLFGVEGNPISGEVAGGIPYYEIRDYATDDQVAVAPGVTGTATLNWTDNGRRKGPCGLTWESDDTRGIAGEGFWGGHESRLVMMYFEWAGLGVNATSSNEGRTGVLRRTIDWLLERHSPTVTILEPTAGQVIDGSSMTIRFAVTTDPSRSPAGSSISWSQDDGESWTFLADLAGPADSFTWDLAGENGGTPVANSSRVRLRVTTHDDGTPSLRGSSTMTQSFTLARDGGDWSGPVVVAGSMRTLPMPIRTGLPASLVATFSDGSSGNGPVTAAEYSIGAEAANPGTGLPMIVDEPAGAASAELATDQMVSGPLTFWTRGRDAAGNWGPPARFDLSVNGESPPVPPLTANFLSPATPNPSRGSASIRYGLVESGTVQLDLFDLLGRHVRTLASGPAESGTHEALWDGRDERGESVASGVFFVRLKTDDGVHRSRLILTR
jgi:hypothetical protein